MEHCNSHSKLAAIPWEHLIFSTVRTECFFSRNILAIWKLQSQIQPGTTSLGSIQNALPGREPRYTICTRNYIKLFFTNCISRSSLFTCNPQTDCWQKDVETLLSIPEAILNFFLPWHKERNFSKAGPFEESKWFLTKSSLRIMPMVLLEIVVELICALVMMPQKFGSRLAYWYVKSCSWLVRRDLCQSYQYIQSLPVPSPPEFIYVDPGLFPVKINFYFTPMQHLAQ